MGTMIAMVDVPSAVVERGFGAGYPRPNTSPRSIEGSSVPNAEGPPRTAVRDRPLPDGPGSAMAARRSPTADGAPPTGRSPGTAAARTRPRLDTVTGLRGLAAAIVFVPHAGIVLTGTAHHIDGLVVGPGNRALGFFFALSGFVLTWSVRPGDTATGFWQRRFARIYPAYIVTLVAAVFVTGVIQRHPLPAGPFLATVFTVQAWFPSSYWYFSYNGVDWTIACEAFFYLLFPLFIRPLAGLSRTGRRRLQVLMYAVLVGFSLAAEATGVSWVAHQFPVARLPEFVLGATLALDIARGEVLARGFGLRRCLALGLALWVLTALPIPVLEGLPLVTIPVLLGLSAGALTDLAGQSSLLSRRAMVWFGEISYCFYLVHQLVLKSVASLLVGRVWLPGQGIIWALLCFALAIPIAWALHRWVEIPGNLLLRGTSRRRQPVTLQQ